MDTKGFINKFGKAFLLSWYYTLCLGVVFLLFTFKAKNMNVIGNLSIWLTVILPIDFFYGCGVAIILTPFTAWAIRLENKFRTYGVILWIVCSVLIAVLAGRISDDFILFGVLLLTVVGLVVIGRISKGRK